MKKLEALKRLVDIPKIKETLLKKFDKSGGEITGDIVPDTNETRFLGSIAKKFNKIFTKDIQVNNVLPENGTSNIGSTSNKFTNVYSNNIFSGNVLPFSNNLYDLGSSGFQFNNVFVQNMMAKNIKGVSVFDLAQGSAFTMDGKIIVKNLVVPKTHSGWGSSEPASFRVECDAYYNELVSSEKGFRVNRDFVPYSKLGATWVIERMDIWTKSNESGTPYLWIKSVGDSNSQSFGVDLWLYSGNSHSLKAINSRSMSQEGIGLDAITNIQHFSNQKANGQPRYNPDLLPKEWVYEVGEEGHKSKNIASSSIIPNITLAMQQQQRLIDGLTKENTQMKERLSIIEKQLGISMP